MFIVPKLLFGSDPIFANVGHLPGTYLVEVQQRTDKLSVVQTFVACCLLFKATIPRVSSNIVRTQIEENNVGARLFAAQVVHNIFCKYSGKLSYKKNGEKADIVRFATNCAVLI